MKMFVICCNAWVYLYVEGLFPKEKGSYLLLVALLTFLLYMYSKVKQVSVFKFKLRLFCFWCYK